MSKIDKALRKFPVLNLLSSQKMIRNKFINQLGAQPARIWLAKQRYSFRPKYLTDSIAPYIKTLQDDGIVVIPDFLPKEEFEKLEKACHLALDQEDRTVIREDGPTFYTNIDSMCDEISI